MKLESSVPGDEIRLIDNQQNLEFIPAKEYLKKPLKGVSYFSLYLYSQIKIHL
jgi:hypothetical protein